MSRGKATFRQRDLERAIKAVETRGYRPGAIRIEPSGAIVVEIQPETTVLVNRRNEWD